MRRAILISIAALIGIALVGVAVTSGPRWYDEHLLGNRAHGRGCADLPSEQDMRALLDRNATTVEAVRAIEPAGTVNLEAGQSCPGRWDLLLTYGSKDQRRQAERLIIGTELESAPISWRNV